MNRKDKLVLIMGATGTGKSRLSIDIASRFPSEIINADKIQLYKGLDITTNKIPVPDRSGVPHHLLGEFDPADGELSPRDFRSLADSTIQKISSRRRLPILVGGSNSLIHALVSPDEDDPSGDLRYNCCFLWVDVSVQVLFEYLNRRVDEMLDLGMFTELTEFYDPDSAALPAVALRKAIGVPEFDRYFAGEVRFEEAVEAIKENTYELALRQMQKIQRLRLSGWDLHRMDATEAFRAVMASKSESSNEAWEKNMLEPSVRLVKRFLEESRLV
ncbi:adenylate isopentenyltransferase-like [Aristolochia californica]|uniref:adenylate isopentenyltransferase-like n=1 Tax=Aristolochia californica TaxID=171875 RepID=UPI0035D75081